MLMTIALAATAAVSATVPQVGMSVMCSTHGYIGDLPYSASTTGTSPFRPGTSQSWTVTWRNAGNVRENVTVSQGHESWMGGVALPATWVRISGPATVTLNPGQATVRVVTISVPASGRPGTYNGLAKGTGYAVSPTGQVRVGAGAGVREYVRVTR